jgi:hypothetical protein
MEEVRLSPNIVHKCLLFFLTNLKTKIMSFKSAECWLLPTKSKSNIGTIMKCIKEMPYNDDTTLNKLTINKNWKVAETNGNKYWQPQHLYITINERPKVGDWYIVLLNGNIPTLEQIKTINDNVWVNKELFETTRHIDNCYKIIATTDSLIINGDKGKSLLGTDLNEYLPQPSKSFIDKFVAMYNKNTPIESCMIEYEQPFPGNPSIFDTLKVNNNNEITIKRCKESWSKEEHINDCKRLIDLYATTYIDGDITEWIKQNL